MEISIPLLTFLDLLGYYLMLGGLRAVIFYWQTIFLMVFLIWSLLNERLAAGEFYVLDLLREW
jgi:hypothetical protein